MEETMAMRDDVYIIENRGKSGKVNPFIGHDVRCTWLKTWQHKQAGYCVRGVLKETFTPNGRTMIGVVVGKADNEPAIMRERPHSCPWAKSWLQIEVLN